MLLTYQGSAPYSNIMALSFNYDCCVILQDRYENKKRKYLHKNEKRLYYEQGGIRK